MPKMKTVTAHGTRLDQLKALARVIAEQIDACDDVKALPQLARQYRETIREIEEIDGGKQDGDEIGDLLAERRADGKPGAVRTHRTGPPV